MKEQEVFAIFTNEGALLSGHFLLSSGLHSDKYFQSALVLQHPEAAEKLAIVLAKKISAVCPEVKTVVSPAMGGIIIGHEVARALGARAVFTERVDGKMILRRGFSLSENEKCVVIEDVITTGISTKEVIESLKSTACTICAVGSLVDRSGGKADFGVPRFSLMNLEVKSYSSEDCPLCKQGLEVVKPGSRASIGKK